MPDDQLVVCLDAEHGRRPFTSAVISTSAREREQQHYFQKLMAHQHGRAASHEGPPEARAVAEATGRRRLPGRCRGRRQAVTEEAGLGALLHARVVHPCPGPSENRRVG